MDLGTSNRRLLGVRALSREQQRLEIQESLDGERTSLQRNKDGQFATPQELAKQIAAFAYGKASQNGSLRILEPSCGSGSFLNALIDLIPAARRSITAVELDPRFSDVAKMLWGTETHVVNADYMEWVTGAGDSFDLLVANPPYVRHHHMTTVDKDQRSQIATSATGISVSKLSGLYLYFILASHQVLKDNAIASWLIPSEFMAVNYGSALRTYLTNSVRLLRVHLFSSEDAQFSDALVSSCVITYKNEAPTEADTVALTSGTDYSNPSRTVMVSAGELQSAPKWAKFFREGHLDRSTESRLGDLLETRRGIATGSNHFFIRTRAEFAALGVQERFLTPILPGPRLLRSLSVDADSDGWPLLDDQFAVVDCNVPLEDLLTEDEALHKLLSEASSEVKGGYLAQKRRPWYRQEQRPPAPIVCTYMGRAREGTSTFRFIRNRSNAIFTNAYLGLYPRQMVRDSLLDQSAALDLIWEMLGATGSQLLVDSGREYGGGLAKLEPRELASVPADPIIRSLRDAGLLLGKSTSGGPSLPSAEQEIVLK